MAEVVTAGPSPDEGTQHPGSVVAALGDVLEALTRSTFDLNEVILASRLSEAAGAGEVLISQRLHAAVDEHVEAEPLSEALTLKGFSRPVSVFRVRELREPSG